MMFLGCFLNATLAGSSTSLCGVALVKDARESTAWPASGTESTSPRSRADVILILNISCFFNNKFIWRAKLLLFWEVFFISTLKERESALKSFAKLLFLSLSLLNFAFKQAVICP